MAKIVVDHATSADDFSSATATLALAVSSVCQESYTSVLWEELQALRQRVSRFQRLDVSGTQRAGDSGERAASRDGAGGAVDGGTIVDRALDYLHRRFTDPDLSLRTVAAALECSPNYLTQRFTQVVGQRMRSYIVGLRVDHASRELLRTDLPIKRIALESGFRDAGGCHASSTGGWAEPERVPPHLRRAMSRIPHSASGLALRAHEPSVSVARL